MTDQRPTTPFPTPQTPPPDVLASLAGRSFIEQVMAVAKASGPVFQTPAQGPRTVALWGFPYVDEVSDDTRFDKALSVGLVALRAFAGDGLFTARTDEPNWGKAHRILLPAFSQEAMQAYHPQMLDLAGQLVLKLARLNPGEPVDVAEEMTRLTLDTIGLCGFDYRFNSFYRSDLHPYVQGMVYTLTQATALLSGGGSALSEDPVRDEYRAAMNAFVDEIVAARKAEGDAADQHRDLLQFMLTGVDKVTGEGLDDVTIRNEINTFLVAGHETTSGLLSFACYFLSKHPEVMRKAQAEADAVLGPDPSVPPTYAQVRKLAYVRQVLDETLRLWPTAPAFARRPLAPDTLAGTWAIEPTDVLRVITPMLHRDPEVWGPDAEAFNPDNFLPDAVAARPANAYKPFGTGQRACIGRQFALQEATLVLGLLLQRFDFEDVDDYQLAIKQTLTIKPDGLRLVFAPRAGRSVAVGLAAPAATTVAAAPSSRPLAAPAGGAPLLVLFGSNLGASEDLAYRVANEAATRGFAAVVAPLDEGAGNLPTDRPLVVVTSSYNGTPPDNAAAFVGWLGGADLAPDALAGVRYAVFGCGNREWSATYQRIPRLVDDQLAAHGATRLLPRAEGDAAGDYEAAADAWLADLWPALGAPEAAAPAGPLYTVERVSAPANPFLSERVLPLTVLVNRELQAGGDRSTRHFELALPEGTAYQTGDHLGIVPRNVRETVERVLRRFGFPVDAFVRVRRHGAGTPMLPLDQPVALIDLLSRYVDLQEVAARAHVETLATAATVPGEASALRALAADPAYDAEVRARRRSLLDLLEAFPSCALPFDRYLEMLHPLRVRYYSISSAPAVDPRACALTVAVVGGPALSGDGRYHGVASTYLARHPGGSVVDGFVRSPNLPFRPPADPLTPVVMVGPGTGLAPFRGFLQDRAALLAHGRELGPAVLYFGCRNPGRDFLYQDELEAWAAHGIVTLRAAFSRPDAGEGRYVQDLIREDGATLWPLLEQGGVVYVCGDGGRMEPAVRAAITRLAVDHGGLDPDAAAAWQADLAAASRYLADVWASGG